VALKFKNTQSCS